MHNTQNKLWGTSYISIYSIDFIIKNCNIAICLLSSRNTASIPSKNVIIELLFAIVRKATKENKICIINNAVTELDFKLKEEFNWINPFELSEHMLKNVYASNIIK